MAHTVLENQCVVGLAQLVINAQQLTLIQSLVTLVSMLLLGV